MFVNKFRRATAVPYLNLTYIHFLGISEIQIVTEFCVRKGIHTEWYLDYSYKKPGGWLFGYVKISHLRQVTFDFVC